jgi:hypothetical protein
LANLPVSFSVSTYPFGALNLSISNTAATTDANGQVSTILTLGNRPGSYRVTAVPLGVDAATFLGTVPLDGKWFMVRSIKGETDIRLNAIDSAQSYGSLATITSTVGLGTNEYSVFAIVGGNNNPVDSVKVGSVRMDSLISTTTENGKVVAFYGVKGLQAGSHTFTAYVSGLDASISTHVMGVAHFLGVNQSSPIENSAKTDIIGGQYGIDITISNSSGNWILGMANPTVDCGPATSPAQTLLTRGYPLASNYMGIAYITSQSSSIAWDVSHAYRNAIAIVLNKATQ